MVNFIKNQPMVIKENSRSFGDTKVTESNLSKKSKDEKNMSSQKQ